MKNKSNIELIKHILTFFAFMAVVSFAMYCLFNGNFNKLKGEVFNFEETNGGVTLNIIDVSIEKDENNKEYINWDYADTKTVKMTVDFKDTISEDKKIIIDLAEGMTYRSYPVLTTTLNDIETVISPDDNLYSAIKDVETPEIVNNLNVGNAYPDMKYSSYGKLVYKINSNVSKVEISFNVMIDQFRFYGDKYAENAINVSAMLENSIIGTISKDVYYNSNDKFKLYVSLNNILVNSQKVLPSTDTKTNYGYTMATYTYAVYKLDNGSYKNYIPYFNKLEYNLYIPNDMEYDSLNTYIGNPLTSTFDSVSYDKENQNIKAIYNSYKYHAYGVGIKYKVGKNLTPGIYNTSKYNSITFVFYDGTEKTLSLSGVNKKSVEVVDPVAVFNKLSINSYSVFEDNDNNTFVNGPSFVIANNDPDDKTNQVLEFIIDPKYEVVSANFPKPKDSIISEIYFRTNLNDNLVKYTGAINNNTSLFNFNKSIAGLQTNEYFTQIKAVIDKYPVNYYSTKAAAGSTANAILFGNLLNGKESGSATIKFYTYDMNQSSDECYEENTLDNCSSWTRNTGKINYTDKLSSAPDTSYSNLLPNKTTVNVGETFTIVGRLNTHSYPYGTRLYINDTEIYIRQPKGLSLNINSISIKDQDNNIISITSDNIKTHTNLYGDTIYTIKTGATVGRYFSEQAISKYLNISFAYKVENDCEISSASVDSLMSWGNKNYETIQNFNFKDMYDLNGNGDVTDNIFATNSTTIAIQPSKSVVISTKIVKDDVESLPYNPENNDTILNLYQDDTFDYDVKIKNNTDGIVSSYELYLPIPKTGNDYGDMFQDNPFTWDMMLSKKPILPEGYKIEYSLNSLKTINEDLSTLNFTSDIDSDQLKNVTMIKVIATKSLQAGESDSFKVSLISGETKESGISKINGINIWNPVSTLTSTSISGEFKGNAVATKLLIPEISGVIYEDKNLDGTYNEDKDLFGIKATASLYKLINNEYKLVEDAVISIDEETGKYDISDSKYLSEGTYAIKFNISSDYNILEDDKVNIEGWVTGIKVSEVPVTAPDIRVIKYDLDFDIDDEIISVDETREISIKNILPDYFETIKNTDITYSWTVLDEFKDCVRIENTNSITGTITGLKACKNAMLEASIYDKYGHKLTKGFNVSIKKDKSLMINSEDISIYVGDKIEFEKYIISAYDYMENKIELLYKDNPNVMYESTIPNNKDIATKPGTYQIKYTITDTNGNVGTKIVKVNVKEKSTGQIIIDAITSPKTNDKVRGYIIGFLVSFALILIMGILYLKNNRKRTV